MSQNQHLLMEMQILGNEPQAQPSQIRKPSRFSRFSRLSVRDLATALSYIRETWKSGMSQTILNLPLVLSMGYSSGANGSIGLTTAFLAAFVNGFLSGSNHSIYMPSWIVCPTNLKLVQLHGPEFIPIVTLLSGITIYLISLMKWHQLSDYLPEFVVEGFYLGVGLFFMVAYSDYAFGLTDGHTARGLQQYSNSLEMLFAYIQRGSLVHFMKSFGVFLFLQISRKLSRPFPSILLTTCFGLFMGLLYPTDVNLYSVYGNTAIDIQLLRLPSAPLSLALVLDLLYYCLPIAMAVTIQNLLCARGAQSLTGVRCDYDQETFCVAVANMVCGIFGGLPCCASSRMYTLDIRLREVNKWSSILNAASIYVFYGLFSRYFLQIPLYVVSGQLYFLLYQFPPWTYLTKLYRTRRRLTLIKCLLMGWICYNYGPIYSTIIGCMHSLFLFAHKMSLAASEIIVNPDNEYHAAKMGEPDRAQLEDDLPVSTLKGSFTLYRFTGSVNYINIKNHINQIKQLADTDYLIFSFRYVSVLDEQAIDKLAHMIENLMKTQHDVLLTGLHRGMLEEMKHNEFFREFFELCPDKYKTLGS